MITVVGWSELARRNQDLLVAARAASQKAFAPYSHFKVGAAVRCGDGRIVEGANYESASTVSQFALSVWRSFRANMEGEHQNISALRFTLPGRVYIWPEDTPVSPCGACRQILGGGGGAQQLSGFARVCQRCAVRPFSLSQPYPIYCPMRSVDSLCLLGFLTNSFLIAPQWG